MRIDNKERVRIYIDGSYSDNNKGIVGAGIVIIDILGSRMERKIEVTKPELVKMRQVGGEITAAIEALATIRDYEFSNVTLYYDYDGIVKWLNGEWKAKNKATREYRNTAKRLLREIIDDMKVDLEFKKIDPAENLADRVAREVTGGKDRH